ncbi:MAG TPA: hypothetical protein GX527_05355 [Clostridiaceae bacterium]|nr:hypothetical protein [Clostridiaceae bacterium]
MCGEKEAGFSLFSYVACGDIKIVPHRCKGRFCSVYEETGNSFKKVSII